MLYVAPCERGGTGRHAGFRFLSLTRSGFESRRSHEQFSPVRSTTRKPEKPFGPFGKLNRRFPFPSRNGNPVGWATGVVQFPSAVHRPLSATSTDPADWFAIGAPLSTTRSAGAEPVLLVARRVRLRCAVPPADAARAGSSPTTRSAGSGATAPTTRRVRARRAVAPSM